MNLVMNITNKKPSFFKYKSWKKFDISGDKCITFIYPFSYILSGYYRDIKKLCVENITEKSNYLDTHLKYNIKFNFYLFKSNLIRIIK